MGACQPLPENMILFTSPRGGPAVADNMGAVLASLFVLTIFHVYIDLVPATGQARHLAQLPPAVSRHARGLGVRRTAAGGGGGGCQFPGQGITRPAREV
jgi:hypothetical protein